MEMSEDKMDRLREFYRVRRIKEEDNRGKYHALESLVRIPCFPYDQRQPSLCELEQQFLKDRVENLKKAKDNVTTTHN